MIAVSACGPGETLPPRVDAGPPPVDAGFPCDGVCVPGSPNTWTDAQLVWMGDEALAPPCPAIADFEGYAGHGYLNGPMPCDACTCVLTNESCTMPSTVTAAAASCADDSASVTHTSSDPPAGWSGTCKGENPIPAGKLCGGVPCVQSITIGPTKSKQVGCLPLPNTNASPPPWNRFVRSCRGRDASWCLSSGEICVPAAPGPEFKQCISNHGNTAALHCPPTYPERSVFYTLDTPVCAPCACGAPDGDKCKSTIQLYQGDSCGTPLGPPIAIDVTGPVCIDVPPGSALQSKSAFTPMYQPGSCKPSGGAPDGTVFCCQP